MEYGPRSQQLKHAWGTGRWAAHLGVTVRVAQARAPRVGCLGCSQPQIPLVPFGSASRAQARSPASNRSRPQVRHAVEPGRENP